jgi:gliding motility-associated-like protein
MGCNFNVLSVTNVFLNCSTYEIPCLMTLKTIKRSILICLFTLASTVSFAADLEISFCPVTKIQSGKEWSATLEITNNTNQVLNFDNALLKFDWQNLESLPYPFTTWNKNGKDVSFGIAEVGGWQNNLAVGATYSKAFTAAKFSGVLAFPTSGTLTFNGTDYTIAVAHCSKTEPYELYDATFDFDRECFIKSPTSNMCLGEGASEIWQGEGVFDAMVPQDRPSWAIGTMVAHRLFTNLAGVEMLSPNFWTATALNESRMTCDPTIVPDQVNHWKINSGANTGVGIDNRTDNCFQVLNIGYTQIENNQPDLFGQTNAYGTASYSTVISGGRYETGALAVTGYHYQDIRYWNQIFCWNAKKFHKEATDPYAIEKVFYHAFHDGPNAGISLLNDIDANYAAAIAATDMNSVINTGGTWSNLGGGSSRKVANFTSLLDGGDGHLYNSQYADGTQEYYGCYEESIKWTDILYYLDKIKILYPKLMDAPVQADIKAVFDGLAGGGNVMFSNLGPVIDEIVIQMGGHDPSGYLATQYSASKVCNESPLGVSLRNSDTLCPGEEGILEVWLAGDKNYAVDIKFPDGSIKSYTNISQSPFNITIDQPGDYEVVYFEDADEVGDINCNFAALTVESKNGSVIGWDKSNVDLATSCAAGDLIITKTGTESVTISYTKDGAAQTDVVMGVAETTKTIAAGASIGEYIITTISPNSCGTPINDTITFCGSCTKPQISILTPDTAICAGDTAFVRFDLTGTADYSLYFKLDGVPASVTGITTDFVVVPVNIGVTLTLDSLVDSTCKNDTITNSITITLNSIPTFDLGSDTSICAGPITFSANIAGVGVTYEWQNGSSAQTFDANATGDYWVIATEGACSDTDSVSLTIGGELAIDLGNDTLICKNAAPFVLTVGNYATIDWNDDLGGSGSTTTYNVALDAIVDVHVIDADGCEGRDTIEITINDIPVVDLGNDTSVCAASGALTLDAGNTGLDFTWEPGLETVQTIAVTTTGEYKVEVTENGCSTRDSITVTVLGSVVLDLGNDTTLCSDLGALTLTANAGFDTYAWDNGANTETISVSTSGTYDIHVVDAAGCEARDTIIVIINTTPVVALGGDATICPTSPAVTFDAGNAGATYLWSSGEITQEITKGNSEAGDYSVIVTSNGCVGEDTINLKVSTELSVDLGVDFDICTGTTTVLDAGFGAGYTFDWNEAGAINDQTFTTGGGEVTVLVADAGGCTGRDTIVITEVNPLSINLGNDTSICIGDPDVVFSMVSGRTDVTVVEWNDASAGFTLSGNATQDYWLEVDSAGCIARDTVALFINALPIVDLGADTFICAGTTPTITLDAGIFVSYQWADITNVSLLGTVKTQDVSAVGFYGVAVVDANGCVNGDTLEVNEENSTAYTLGVDTTICPGGSVTVSVPNVIQANATWAWLNDNSTGTDYIVNNQVDGNVINVILEYTNEFGCLSNDTVKVTVDNVLPITALRDTAICEGEDVLFTSGYPVVGYTFTWQDASISNTFGVTGAVAGDAGTIEVDIVSAEGCTGNASVDLTVNLNPIPTLTDGSICVGQKTILDHGLANVTALWAPTNEITNTIEITTAGTYSVVVTDANSCIGTASADLVVNVPPVVNLGTDQILCEGEIFNLSTGFDDVDYTNVWSGASTSTTGAIDITVFGDYGVVVTDVATGCSESDTINFIFNAVPDVDLGNDTALCEGETLEIFSNETNPTYTYLWSTNDGGQSITVSTTGIYTLTVTNGSCSDVDDLELLINPLPITKLGDDTIVCFEDLPNGLVLDPGRVGVDYVWNTTETSQTINVTERGVYLVDITSAEGCSIQDMVTIKQDCPAAVWLPNAFTVDGDGLNDTWVIKGRGVLDVQVHVFNRWGELIWTGNGIDDSWDGTYNGNTVQVDVYIYKLTYSYLDVNEALKTMSRVGTVAVIR